MSHRFTPNCGLTKCDAAWLFRAKSRRARPRERMAVIEAIAADPRQGDPIRESGGLRKVRFGGRGKGKSGGYRVITGYFGPNVPVYLVALLSKRDRGNFSKAEIAGFRKLTTDIARYWRGRST